jgi:hypothetical protein
VTVPAHEPRIIYEGSGTTGPFAVTKDGTPIIFKSNSHIHVKKRVDDVESTLVENTDYTLTGGPDSGEVTLVDALAEDEFIAIYREQPIEQSVSLEVSDPFNSTNVELQYDKIFLILQELKSQVDRAIKVSATSSLAADVSEIEEITITPANDSALTSFIQAGDDAVERTAQNKMRESVTPEDFGADPTGANDSLAAFEAAFAEHDVVIMPNAATYKLSDTLTLSRTGQTLLGAGPGQVTLTSPSTTAPMIVLANGVANFRLQGFKLTRSVTATSGANGIQNTISTDRTYIGDIWIEKQYDGLKLASCDIGWVERVISEKNIAHGIYLTNSSVYGPAQWHLNEILAQFNTVDGIRVQVTDGPAGLILGDWTNIKTFANSARGIIMLGSATTGIYDTRINGGFIGSDGLAGIYMDTYGSSHRICDVFVERAGMDATGPTVATPAGNAAHGFEFTANNDDVQIDGAQILTNSYTGITSSADNLVVSGSRIYDNGAAVGAERRGIVITAGDATITGNGIGNTNGGTSQTIGIATAVDTLTVVGNHFDANSSASMNPSVDMVNSIIWGNRGNEALDSATNAAGLKIRDSNSSHRLKITTSSNLTDDRVFALILGDADRSLTLDNNFVYTEGTWTPTMAFATPGNSSIVLSSQIGHYTRIGRMVILTFQLVTSTFTHTTASGNMTISGLPFTANATLNHRGGSMVWQGITKANYSEVVPSVVAGTQTMLLNLMGSGQSATAATHSDMPSGGSVILSGSAMYFI